MSGWVAKRFWKEADAVPADGGFTVRLDGRAVKTPAKALLVVPTLPLAEAIAGEWQAQAEVIRPDAMPLTRAANSAQDKVVPQFDAVVQEIAKFGGTDLLCYREQVHPVLRERQQAWDPLLDWARDALDAPLQVTRGMMPVPQPEASVAALHGHVRGFTAHELVGLHDLVAISGSLVLGLAVAHGRIDAPGAFALSRIDETFQAEEWGVDEDAADSDEKRLQAFLDADRFLRLCR